MSDILIVAGAPLSHRRTQRQVTKYHPDTGAPYQATIEASEYRVGDVVVDLDAWRADERLEKWVHAQSSEDDSGVLGVAVVRRLYHQDGLIEVPNAEAEIEEARKYLASLGYAGETKLYVLRQDRD